MKSTVKLACALAMSSGFIKGQQTLTEVDVEILPNLEQINAQNINKIKFLGSKEVFGNQEADQINEPTKQWINEEDKQTIMKNAKGLTDLASRHVQHKFDKLTSFSSAGDLVNCQHWDDDLWFNLIPLQKEDNNDFYDVKGFKQGVSIDESILFKFCESFDPTSRPGWEKCDKDRSGYLTNTEDPEKTCHSLTAANPTMEYKRMVDGDNKTTGISLLYKKSEQTCASAEGNYGLNLTVLCNEDLEAQEADSIHYLMSDGCTQVIEMYSGAGCPAFDLNEVFNMLEKYRFLWGLILLFIGLVMTFFGRKLIKYVVFIVIFIIVALGFLLLFYTLFLKDNSTVWIFWVLLSVCVVLGILIGALSVKFEKAGIAVMGGIAGFFLALLVLETVQLRNEIVFWIILAVSALIFFVISFKVSEYIKIFTTSLLGGYCTVRGISCFAGGFPNEFTTVRSLSLGIIGHIEWYFYVYLVFIVIVSSLGSVWQVRKYRAEDDKHPYHHPNPYKTL